MAAFKKFSCEDVVSRDPCLVGRNRVLVHKPDAQALAPFPIALSGSDTVDLPLAGRTGSLVGVRHAGFAEFGSERRWRSMWAATSVIVVWRLRSGTHPVRARTFPISG